MNPPSVTVGLSATDFMAALDAATTRRALDELLPALRQVRCPFRQRQGMFTCWQTKSNECTVAAPRQSAAIPVLTVEPVAGERGRFWVESRTNDGIPYLVDLEEFNGNGWCGCKGFLHYIVELEAGAEPSPKLQCRHIKAVRKWMESLPPQRTKT